jgi:hypothetical protein
MAIGPDVLTDNFMDEIELYEEKLDSILKTKKLPLNSSINLDIPDGMNITHFKILKERYLDAGWKGIEWNENQRDGQWISFKN